MLNPNQLNHNIDSSPNPLDSIEQSIDNQGHSVDNLEPHSNIPDQSDSKELLSDKIRIQNELGAKTLSLADFESKHKNIVENLDTLMSYGANINAIVNKMSPSDVAENREKFLAYGANLYN